MAEPAVQTKQNPVLGLLAKLKNLRKRSNAAGKKSVSASKSDLPRLLPLNRSI